MVRRQRRMFKVQDFTSFRNQIYVLVQKGASNQKSNIKNICQIKAFLSVRKDKYTNSLGNKNWGGFYIGHCGRIIINPRTVLGKNINIATGVTIGQENRGKRKGCPIIGDNVWIGTNAVIVGNITIGTDVLIAPLAYVNFDVPDHSIVIGNPAKIIHRENATEGYINRTV